MSTAPKVQMLPPSALRESPDNPRKLFGDLDEFAKTLKSQGIIQPIIARATPQGPEIVAGHRRTRAAKLAGLKEVPVIVREMSRQDALEAMIIENNEREDVNPLELADGFAKLQNDFGLSVDDIAERVGVVRATVFNTLNLLKLAEPVQKAILAGKLPASAGYELYRVKGERLQLRAFEDALALGREGEPPSARAVKRLVQQRYAQDAKQGLSRRQREARTHGAELALRRRALEMLLNRVGELIERKHHFDETDLRTMAAAKAETGGETAREVFQRHGARADRLSKVGPTQLRKLLAELAYAPWATLEDGEYSAAAKALARAYGLSLSDMEKTAEATATAEGLFEKT